MDLPMAELIKLAAKMASVMHEEQLTLTLSGAPGDSIDQPPMYYSQPVLLIQPALLPITWICRSLFQNLDCRILEF